MKISLVTGGFDPLHSGHIEYLKAAWAHGDRLWVGLNSDQWLVNKKGYRLMPAIDRYAVVYHLAGVDRVFFFNDDDGTANNAIDIALMTTDDDVVFCNGGDRNETNIPEYEKYSESDRVSFQFGVGGDKIQSSSDVIEEYESRKTTIAPWGEHKIIYDDTGLRVKILSINPGSRTSLQSHDHRYEKLEVLSGSVLIKVGNWEKDKYEGDTVIIRPHEKHRIENRGWGTAKILEVQTGSILSEDDITRYEDDYGRVGEDDDN
ncbi:MAG: adenylyltransferase/cytidyltransferase family protein [Candidatus Dadabacteria bacterium]|nr:adenylyltransferase/cytidyltransferase family protein [Candidatus Dadabacteria bacterium]